MARLWLRVAARTAQTAVALVLAGDVQTTAARVASTDVSANRLVAIAAQYVQQYQQDFSFLVAEETSTQHVSVAPSYRDGVDQSRVTHGEMFLTYLANERQWTSVHDVADVDGVPVTDRDDLTALLNSQSVPSVARRVFARNARYNIGSVVRNFNDPMFALLTLTADHRSNFAFSVRAVNREDPAHTLATLSFRERDRPTLVRDAFGRPVFSHGEFTIDAETGTVRHTSLMLTHDDIDAELTTDFVADASLSLWVPSVFLERYTSTRDRRVEVTTCDSRYTNYRRFDVTWKVR